MKQPHVPGRSRPGVGSKTLKENAQPESRSAYQCPECFTDWAIDWDPSVQRMCVCGKKALPVRKTKHLVNMDHPTGNWLLFVTGNGITWARDGKSEPDVASASGDVSSGTSDKDFKMRHSVDIGLLAEAPLLGTEVLNRVVDAETFPSEVQPRPQNSKDCKKDQAALVFHLDAAAAMALVAQCQLDMHVATMVPDNALPMEAKKLEPGSPEAKVALLHHMINVCDGEIRMHAGRWRKYESTEVPPWAKQPQPSWDVAQALERRTHRTEQGSNFLEFHMYTDEELEDHRRLGLRPCWSSLKGSFFAYEPAHAGGCRDLSGEGGLWPSVLLEAAVVCLAEPAGGGEKAQPWATWWWSTGCSRASRGKEEDPEGDHGLP